MDSLTLWLVEDRPAYATVFSEMVAFSDPAMRLAQAFSHYADLVALIDGPTPWADPDVVIMDIGLPDVDGIEATADLLTRLPDVPVVMLTSHDDPDIVLRAFHAGAAGYVLKDAPADRIVQAIVESFRGGMLMPTPVARHVTSFLQSQALFPPRVKGRLSGREREVLAQVGEGLTREEIGLLLHISPHTVESHLKNIYRKLQARNNVEAVAKAFRDGILT